jgi:tetratricopeptide (TPR) repeat protein
VDDENEIPTQADSAEEPITEQNQTGEETTIKEDEPPKAEESIKEYVSTEEDGPTQKAVAIEVIKDQPENKATDDDNISYLEEEVSDHDAVTGAAKWVQKLHKISALNSLWYERLGETFRILDLFDDAVETLTKATKLENANWTCSQNLALALASRDNEGDLALAIAEMEKVLDTLRQTQSTPENTEDTKLNLITNLKQMARWQILQPTSNVDKSQECHDEILRIDPDDLEANYWTLDTLRRPGREQQFLESLEELSKRKSKDSELTVLGGLLIYMATVEDRNIIFELMFLATQKTSAFDVLMANLQDALELARKENLIDELPVLLLQTGIALYHFDQRDQKNPESALALWTECGALSSSNSSWGFQGLCKRAYRLISFHYYHRAIASKDPSPHVEMLKQVLSRHQIIDQWAKAYLGCYYASVGDNASAKKLFLNDFMTALGLLSDEPEWNDYQGYLYLADILMHSGDNLNALSAWSLIVPTDVDLAAMVLDEWKDEPLKTIAKDLREYIPSGIQTASTARETFLRMIEVLEKEIAETSAQETRELNDQLREDALNLARVRLKDKLPEPSDGSPREGSLTLFCDGKCDVKWSYADDLYSCKSCPDVQFCKDCRDKLKAGKLQLFICSPDHDWLHIPKWDDEEYVKVGRGKVKVGGTWDGEKRVEGEVVTIEAWLDSLRDLWGVAKPTANDTAAASTSNSSDLLALTEEVS